MKRITAICTTAAIIFLMLMAHVTICYAAEGATPPDATATTESSSDMVASGAIAAQAIAPEVSERFLVIRIPIPENNVLLISVAAVVVLVIAAVIFARRHKGKVSEGETVAAESETELPAPVSAVEPATNAAAAQEVASADAAGKQPQAAGQSADGEGSSTSIMGGGTTLQATQSVHSVVQTAKPEQENTSAAQDTDMQAETPDSYTSSTPAPTDSIATAPSPATSDATGSEAVAAAPAVQPPKEAALSADDVVSNTATAQTPSPDTADAIADTPQAGEEPAHTDTATSAADLELAHRIEDFVAEQMHNVDLSVDDIAEAMCMSRSTLFRSMKRIYGINPNEYLRQRRLSYAAELLLQNKYTISDICLLVGFNSPSYFSSCFKKQYNVLPKDYRGR